MSYQDYNGFDQTYFEGRNVSSPHPAGYTEYGEDLLPFGHYAKYLRNEIQNHGNNSDQAMVCVVGCAYGFTVAELDRQGTDSYGMDISQWAVDNSVGSVPIVRGDVTSFQDLRNARQTGRPDIVYNECMLECLTDSEAQTACDNMRNEATTVVIHRVWTTDGSDLNTDEYNSKSLTEWKQLCDPDENDIWYTNSDFQPGVYNRT